MARNERAVIIIGSSVGSAHRSDTFREAVSTRTNRDKNRIGRGGHRGSGRGGAVKRGREKPRRGHIGRVNRGGLNSRGKSSNNDNSNFSQRNDICGFCQEPGHWQRHRQVLKRSRQQYLHSKSKQNDMEYVQIATEQIIDNRFDYSYSRVRANIVIETALVSTNKMKISWKIDSGATRNFSGRLGDFSVLKRWLLPKSVSIADGNTSSSDGYGTCKIGDLILKDVWYIPAFKDIGLMPVGALNKDGVRLVFENCLATATKDSKILFKAPLQDNLF
ncbi:hypothetical protein K3495_g10021 [Podosphaera aphanis]|nr:hypothetical protein K3495_g10021 [Podosphaera aphanis]